MPVDRAQVDAWVRDKAQESQTLEFKRAASLTRAGSAPAEIVKDVTGMANAVGGLVIYGIQEEKQDDIRVARTIDPITDGSLTREWLTQVITSNTGPSFRAFEVFDIQVDGGRVVAVEVTQSGTAVQSALDRRYYQRASTVVEAMLDFQVRDVMARRTSPAVVFNLGRYDLGISADRHHYGFEPRVENIGGVTLERGYLEIDIPVPANPRQLLPAGRTWDQTQAQIDHHDYVRFGVGLPELHPEQQVRLGNGIGMAQLNAVIEHPGWHRMSEHGQGIHWRVYSPHAAPIRGVVPLEEWCRF